MTSHEQTRIHKIHHGLDLGEATTCPFIVYFVLATGPTSKWHFVWNSQVGVPKIPKIGISMSLGAP